jgi:uncharacterized protein with NRDE domain
MCLIAFAIGARPGLPLLLAANRDEFFERPTASLHHWSLEPGPAVLAGRDLRDGGTWLGVSEAGRVAMLTNVRSTELRSGTKSRGELATRWLAGDLDLPAMHAAIDPTAYAGFNLVVGDLQRGQWAWLSNCDPDQPHAGVQARLTSQALAPGIYGLSNAALDTPWPKTRRLKSALRTSVDAAPEELTEDHGTQALIHALADATPAAAHELPQTGIDPERERRLSAPFVHLADAGYGTRSSLVLRVAAEGGQSRRIDAEEWTHTPEVSGGAHGWDSRRRVRETLTF